MSKKYDLSEAISELRHCGEVLIGVSETFTELFSNKTKEKEEALKEDSLPFETKEVKTVSKEDLRKLLGIKLKQGYREQIQELFHKYGGEKLKDIDPSHYAELLQDAEGL